MSFSKHIAKHVRDVYFAGNWTVTNLKEVLEDVTWQEATTKVHDFNTIATLTYHINYFVKGVTEVLQGQPLTIRDKYSFDHPPIHNAEDWAAFKASVFNDATVFADLIEKLDDDTLLGDFIDGKYGSYYRNLTGIVEHFHYHLGQIVLIKKLVKRQ